MVTSPDGTRILARPNGLAGWALPSIAVDLPFEGWTTAAAMAAERAVGAPVEPITQLDPRAWVVQPRDRVPAVGITWIDEADADRLGADAGLARAWFSRVNRVEDE